MGDPLCAVRVAEAAILAVRGLHGGKLGPLHHHDSGLAVDVPGVFCTMKRFSFMFRSRRANSPAGLPHALWALMLGNLIIGTGVMVVPGTQRHQQLTGRDGATGGHADHSRGHPDGTGRTHAGYAGGRVGPAAAAGGLAAVVRAAAGACALAPTTAPCCPCACWPWSPAVFTPQAAASVGLMVPSERRGQAITFVFLGWSVASVMGMPLSAWVGGTLGWRWAFGGVALGALVGGWWLWRVMPDGIKPVALSRRGRGAGTGLGPADAGRGRDAAVGLRAVHAVFVFRALNSGRCWAWKRARCR